MKQLKKYIVSYNSNIRNAIKKIDAGGIGFAVVLDEQENVIGVISDGDFRRAVLTGINMNDSVLKISNSNFKYLEDICSDEDKLGYLNQFGVEALPVIKDHRLIDLITHDFLQENGNRKIESQINLPVVIMAGGKGARLAPFTKVLPKPLIPIGKLSIIEIIMNNFNDYGMDNFYLTLNYKAGVIKAYLKDANIPYNIKFIDEEKELGTAGSLYDLKGIITTDFFVSNCDVIIKDNYSDIYKLHKRNNNALTVITSLQHYKIPYGVCKIENGGKLKEIQEKPEYDILINTGMYLLAPEALDYIPKNKFHHITDLIHTLMREGLKVGTYPVSEKSYVDIGQWKEYKEAVRTFIVDQ
jgi:dTDP-glucose pyrophosphorylase